MKGCILKCEVYIPPRMKTSIMVGNTVSISLPECHNHTPLPHSHVHKMMISDNVWCFEIKFYAHQCATVLYHFCFNHQRMHILMLVSVEHCLILSTSYISCQSPALGNTEEKHKQSSGVCDSWWSFMFVLWGIVQRCSCNYIWFIWFKQQMWNDSSNTIIYVVFGCRGGLFHMVGFSEPNRCLSSVSFWLACLHLSIKSNQNQMLFI